MLVLPASFSALSVLNWTFSAKQRVIPIKEFAEAMLETDSGFTDRVRRFEERFGKADSDTLAVLAQAAYFCWGNNEYRNGIVEVCRAIKAGRPTSFFYHGQITPRRWAVLNTYVIGVQNWLGVDRHITSGTSKTKIKQIEQWLGKREPAKDALAAWS